MTVLTSDSAGFTLQWTKLRANINRVATFYVIIIKRSEDTIVVMKVVPGKATTVDIGGLKPSSKYRLSVYGVDDTGQPYKSLESLTSTTEGKKTVHLYLFSLYLYNIHETLNMLDCDFHDIKFITN